MIRAFIRKAFLFLGMLVSIAFFLLESEHGQLSAKSAYFKIIVWAVILLGIIAVIGYKYRKFSIFASAAQFVLFLPLLMYGLTLDR